MDSRARLAATLIAAMTMAPVAANANELAMSDSERIHELESTVEMLAREIQRLKERDEERQAAGAASATAAGAAASSAGSSDSSDSSDSDVEQKVNVLAREVDRIKTAVAVPEYRELKSVYGLGPAASKVYQKDYGLSIGGYGEITYKNLVADADGRNDSLDALRGVLYFGYKFSDWLVFNSEIEFEHGTTSSINGSSGSVSIEFATVDFLLSESVHEYAPNVRAGLLLAPLGIINEMHEPTTFYGVSRPEPERQIIPTTFREVGAGLFGEIGDSVRYEVYGMGGLNAKGFTSSGLRGGRQKGNRAIANDFAFTARVEATPADGLLLGTSVWVGDSGQDQNFSYMGTTQQLGVLTTIWEVHAQYEWQGVKTRLLYTQAHVGDAYELSMALGDSIAERMLGGYAEVGYDVLPFFVDTEMRLEPFYRWSITQTQNKMPAGIAPDRSKNFYANTVGLQFYPHPQVVIKANYRNFEAQGLDSKGREKPDEFQLGLGYVF